MVRICLVGDERSLSILRETLLETGHAVTVCSQEVVYDTLTTGQFDLIFIDIDWHQPETGWNLLTFLQLDSLHAGVPVVVCSGKTDELIAKRDWLRRRGIGVIEKPFELDDLYGSIERAVSRMAG